jgi:hypothetical protein
MIVPAANVETAFRGTLLAPLGHKAHRMRSMPQGNLEHLFRRRHFKIERTLDALHQKLDIGVPDVTAVFTQMRSDAIGPSLFRNPGGAHRIRMIPAPRITDRRDMVNVHP